MPRRIPQQKIGVQCKGKLRDTPLARTLRGVITYTGSRKCLPSVAYPGILFGVGGFNTFSRGQRERGSGDSSPLVRSSGGSCDLVQEVSYSKIFLIFGTLRLYDDNQFICHYLRCLPLCVTTDIVIYLYVLSHK